MDVSRPKIGFAGCVRRVVALLALTAWILGTFACPDANDAAAAVHSSLPEEHHNAASTGSLDIDPSCQVLAHFDAVPPSAVAIPEMFKIGAHFAYAVIPVALQSATRSGSYSEVIRPCHGPPRSAAARFATFWSHAPPAIC